MARDRIDTMYDALVSDGAQIGTRQQFKKLMLAPGKEGYRNRLGFYQAMKQDGANIGDTYEDFGRALGLHAVKPQRKTRPVTQKPITTAQRAMQVPYRPNAQLGKASKSASKNASPFVQSLYEIDEAQKGAGYPVDYTSPKATQQVYQRNQRVRRQAAKTAARKMDRQASHAQPIMQTNTPADTYIGKTEGQLMDEMNQSANALVGSEMGDYLDKVIGDEFKAAHARGLAVLSANSGVHGTGGADWWIGERAYQNQMDQDKQLQEITGNIQKNIESIFSDPKVKQRVLSDARRLGVSPEAYIESSLAPALIEKAGEQFNKTQLNRMMAKGASDYIASGILNSLTGTLLTGLTSTKSQRQMQQQADAMTEEGLNPNYKPGTLAKAAKGAVAFAADAPWYNLAGYGAGALTEKVFGNTAQQMARMANQSLRQRVFEGVARGVVHGGATGFQYGAINGAVQNYSTGEDTSLWGTLKAAAKGGLEESVSFATMEGMGGAVGAFGHGIGLKGTEKTWKQRVNKMGQKLTYEGIKTGMEGIGMATGGVASSYANHVLTGDDWHGFSTEGTLESCASAVIFKLTHAKDLFKKETDRNGKPFSFTSNIAQKAARFFLSGEAKSAPHVFSDEEKHQLFSAGSELGMKPMENIISWAKQAKKYRAEDIEKSEDGSDLLNNYQQIMQDPNVSWDAKAKFTTMVMGTMPESRPMMDHISYGTEEGTDGDNRIHTYKTINEYASDGTLLSKHRFDTKDKRESIIYEIGVRKEELRSKNALALLVGLDRNNYDLQNAFFKENAKDWEQVQGIVEGMQTGGSKIDHQFTEYVLNSERGSFLPIVDAVANKNGMDREGMLKAFDKDPMKRSDAEQNACVQLRKAIEMEVFPANKVHEEQSNLDGKDVATDNNLGTEQPNGGAVKAELNGLKQAEDEMDALIRDNDVFGQNFQRLKQQGLTNPQIYDWMVQQGGLTVEQLEPFAHYINANARVQGMQEATKNAIDQHVSSYVQDWTFHGTLNGQEAKGEQAIFVQDRSGRTLILGSGEVAFDSTTGRAKEGVGDMIVCLDPNTHDVVYLKSDEVTLSQTQDAENFGNEYRQKLQMINSQPYNEAAQKQAMIDAAKPQQENGNMEGNATSPKYEGDANGAENNSTERENPELYKVANSLQGKVGQSLAKEEADNLVSEMENRAEPARELELTPENWTAEFGEDGKVTTPLGEVKMGENQYFKLAKEGRNGKLGLIKPTLENPDVIIEDASQAKEGQVTERHSSYLFVKAFTGKDGNRVYYFTSVTVSRDGKEVVVSNQERRAKRIATLMESGNILYLKGNQSASVAQNEKPVSLGDSNSSTTTGSQGALHGINSPDLYGKDTDNSSNGNGSEATLTFENGEKVPVDANGEPDFLKMTPEQGAEVYKMLFEEDAEKQIDSDIKTLEKDLKKVQNAKYEGASVMERAEARKKAKEAIAIAEAQVEKAKAIKKTMTAKKVAETVGNTEEVEGAHEAGNVAAQKFANAPRLVGNKRTRMLPDGETKIKGHYEIVPAESLTPSHDVNNGYKKSEGFPTDAEGRTVNDRDYEHDKAAQHNTDQIAMKYNGMAIENVPVVSDEGIVYDGNGRTMAGQKAAKEGTDGEYINDLLENAENFGFTREQIEQSGIEHPRLVMVTDERLPYDAATFAKFNRNEKKTQSNTEQAVAKAKTLTSDEVGAIVAEIEGNGSLDAFFNNSKAINDLVKTLVDKGIIGQNEVAQMMDSPERLSAQGREYVKNLLLGSIFKPETIRMLGIDSAVKNKAINAIRSVMDNMKLGDYSLRDEIDQAIQLLYEARRGGNKVDTLLRTPDMFGEDAAKRYPSISQMMALALEGKVADFRDLLDEYNRIAASRNTGEGNMFEAAPTKEELINEYLNFKKWQDYGTGHSENEGSNDVSGTEEPQQETPGGNEPAEAGAEPDDLVNKELESRIKVTDEETETPSKNGPIMKQKIVIDGDKEVMKVDEPNEKGEYTGSYYEFDGKKFGDLKEVADYIDSKQAEGPLPLLPREEKPDPQFNPIEAAAAEFKKEHPLTENEIMKSDVDDLSKDMALDYLNGEVIDDLHRAIYESIYAKRNGLNVEPKVDTPKTEPSADPMEEIKNAAEGFEKEKKTKIEQGEKPQQKADDAAVSASNKKVNDLWKELMNAGKDEASSSFIGLNSRQLEVLPKLVSAMAENAYLRIKRGMHNLEDVVKEMRKEFAPAAKIFKKEDVDAIYEQMMNIRYRDGEQRMSLKDWADYYEKTSPKHQENLVGDSKSAEQRKVSEKKFMDRVNTRLGFGQKINGIVELRKMADECGLKDVKDTDLQELAETAIVQRARGIASSESTNDAEKFKRIKKLYENQPSLNQRDSERVMKQQYSTPVPYAFLADMYVKGKGKEIKSALEPSAGNGMLTIGLPKDAVHVNDIDAQRLANLRRQGFKNVTSQDGTLPFADKDVDVVVTNPPFGSATPKEYDGYKISSLEGQMAINALESMKDDGRAAIIIGGKTEYAKNGSLNPKDKAFLGYLYSHYNVEDVINVDGSLYAKQGTSYPTRIILINGRRLDENVFPPVKDKARAEAVKDYDELYKRIEDDILRGERMDSSIGEGRESTNTEPDKQGSAGAPKERVRAGERGGSKPDDKREPDLFDSTSVSGTHDDMENQRGTEPRQDGGLPDGDTGTDRTGAKPSPSKEPTSGTNEQRGAGSGGAGRNDAQLSSDEPANTGSGSGPRRQLQRVDQSVRGLSTEKVTYAPKSENPFTLKAVMPADQQEAVNKNLEKLGDADQFLVDELGYNDKDDLYSHLAAEQVDSVALALQQAKKGNAFIIGDMTGIGKGRQAASLIRYAKKQGQVPVYFTKTAGLLSDVYRDLVDIGSPELRPFVFGSAKEAAITDSDGNVVFALPSKNEVKRVLDYIEKNGKLPDEYDYVLTTYSQVSNGVYEFDENGNRKEKKLAKGKSFGAAALSGQKRRDAIEKLMGNAYLILDESHTAGGNSGQGNYFQHIIQKAKNVTFFSATFAKRPDNMPIYALRTAMNEGGMKSSDLIDAVKRGGATLQEIMSQTLTQCGQMIRRERDMTGVTIDWKAIDEPEKVQEQREQYDSIIGLFNDIINFQRVYVSDYVSKRNEELAEIQSTIGIKKGTAALGIKNQPFASKAFNTVQQVLLSLKAKSAAERAIDYLKQGMKPVIALNNTNESQTGNLALGEEMDAPDLGTSLKKGLEGTLRYTQKDAKDNSESGYIKLSDLGEEATEAYHKLEKKIEQTSTGLSLSPIDVIKNELEKAGYKVGELTGRQTEFTYNDNGTVTKVKRADTDKKKLAREFNDGQIDALILNKSAATGISLHASSKYKDQRKRVMIVAQQQLDVNDEVQMRGRIDRTGQVARGAYEYVVSLIPAEQRLLMMFKAKLKSLDANTTSSQKSKFNEMDVADITNKYGDRVFRGYMAEHLDLYSRMADPFGWEKVYGEDLSSIDPQKLMATASGMNGDSEAGADASKLLGRMALLRVNEQEKMLQEIGELYANEIQRLNEMGENDLEITELPLKAKTIRKEVWKEGTEPGSDNAFADNTYIEKVNMAILKKPMKASEVQKAQEGLTGGKTWDGYKEEKSAAVKEYFDQKIADETQKYEDRAVKAATKAKEKYIRDAKKNQKDSGMTDEQIDKMAGYQYESIYKQEKEKLDGAIKNIKTKKEAFERVFDTFSTDDVYVLPVDMNNPNEISGMGNSYGRLIDIKVTDNFSPNASTISFATLDGRRKITFPVAGKVGSGDNRADIISAIDRMTKQAGGMGDKHLSVLKMNKDNWDRLVSSESRKDGYIVTGNLMQALVDSKDQGLGGQLVKYTTDTGEVKTGILMPDRFDPKGLTTDAPINSVADKFELSSWHGGIDEVTSSDGEVKVKRIDNYRGYYFELRVPKSKAKGGKYFMDEDLLKLVNDNNFETRGNTMLAEFEPNQLKPVLDRLSKMGVKVQEERKTSEDEGTHFREDRGLQYSKTGAKDVKNSRIIPEDVDKNVSSQIEKTFDSAIEEIVENAEDRDKSRLVDDADHAVDEFSNLGRSVIEYYRNDYERKVEKLSGQSIGGHLGGKNDGKGNRGSYLLQYYKTILAVADRELAYRDVRAKNLRETWGLQPGGAFALGDVERIFKETNRDKAKAELFQKALDISKRLGVNIKVSAESPNKTSGEADIYRNIDLYIDGLVKTKAPDDSATTIMLHEMIHEATMGAINLVKKGKAEGVLTPKQIEGVKTILEIYDRVKDDKERFKEEPYGLTDAYELTAQMADSRQRKAMDLSIWDRVVNAAHEFARKGDRSILQRVKDAMKKLFEISDKDKMDKALNDIMDDFNETIDDISMNEIEQDGFAYKVTDKDELDRLNKEKTFRMYSGMQEVDGKLYSPMAAIIDGKRTDATEIGAWMGADERPDLVKNGKFQLVKTDKNPGAGEGPVPAAYNPYMHTSTSVMNDQFSGAYARGNIKVVEWEIPESEKTSGYRAEGAKNSVGLVPWTSGTVNSLLPKDRQRSVMLSRWRKAIRILPDKEVAEKIADQLRGTGLAIPWNVVTPNQLRELVKLGVPITTVEQGRQNPETKEKFLKQMAELEQEFPQAKFVNVKMTKDAYKEWGKDGGTKFREENGSLSPASSETSMGGYVENVAKKVGAKVQMVSSVDEITNKAAKAAIEEGRKITGWYDEKTGEVHLYMPNIHDRYTAEKTIWHETVGHKGMRGLMGESFDKFLDSVWYDLDKPGNADLKKLVTEEMKYSPLDYRNAIEEGIARMAEEGKGEPGFWNTIKNKVSDFFHELGYRMYPNTKDVKYLLWLSKNLQKNPNDPYWKMRAEAVRYRLSHEDVRSVVSHDGVFYENDGKSRSLADLPKAEYQEATDGEIHFRTTPTAATALDRYHRSLDAHGYMATESYMDNMLSLKKLMNAIVPDKKIEDIASSENPYILQNVMQGIMSDAAKMFEINIMSPLEKAMAGVLDAFDGKKTDDKIRNFNIYMITKHGLERNRVFFVRDAVRKLYMDDSTKADADKLQSDWDAKKDELGNQLRSGIIDLRRYYEKMDGWIRDNVSKDYEAGEHDYSGMHGVQDMSSMKDPYNDGEAIQSVMDSEAKMESVKAGSVRDYWNKVRAATRYSVDSDYNNGIIDRDLHGHVSKMFDWYVPLRNYDETTAEDVYGYITEVGDPKNRIGSTIAKARGHKYLSETNILAQIGALGNRAIKNGGDNAIRQAFARFARSHSDNNLVKETSVWYVKDPTTGIVEERYPDIPEGATADEINQIVSDFDTDMRLLKAQGLATKTFNRGNIGYHFERAKDKSQHIVDVMIAGKKHSFVILGNPRAAQALNGMLEHKNESLAGRTTAAISRFMAQACTSYNPEFVMRNMVRDFEFASTNLLAKEGMAYTKTFEKYYAQVGLIEGIRNTKLSDFKKMTGFGLFSKYRNGTLDTSDKIQRYFKEFMENGGETGWVQIKNMKDLTAEYKLHVKTEKNGKARVSKNVFDFIFKNLENANEVAENLARFATYCASRDAGRSTVRSAYDAKEVSVNFNRHGSGNAIYSFKNGEMSNAKTARKNVYGFWASWFRNSSMFFNAGVQSTNLLIKNFKNNKVGTIGYIMAGPMMSGMAMALINNMLIASEDEKDRKGVKDPYGELPDYIRRNNLCIYVGGGEFITIPLAIEERAFYGLGDLAADLTFSKNISGQKNPALDAVGCMSQLVPVADYLGNASFGKNPGEETIKAIAPSAVSPIFEWFFNSDWKGAPIHRENKFDENQPSWMLAYKGTPEWLININKKANAWSNDVAPGNENMKGNDFLDAATDPSLLQHLYSSYLGGAATFMERVGGLVKKGKDTETKDIPFVRSLFYTPSEQTSLQRTKSKWYNYLDETEKARSNVKRLKSKNVPVDELVRNYGDYFKFKQSKDAEKINVIEAADKQMREWKKLRNKSGDTESINFANQNIDNIMMRAVDELDKLN